MKLPSLSLAFPAYNEEANVAKTIETALRVGQKVADEIEVIVVNDGSWDRTKAIVEEFVSLDSRVQLVDHPKNKGYGQSVWDGLRAATKEWVFFSDTDLQFDLDEIERLVEFTPDFDIILGVRTPRRDPFMRLANARMWHVFIRLLFGLKVKDIDCAFKLFRRSVLSEVTISSGGAVFSTELLLRLQKKGHLFKEIPVSHLPRQAGTQTGAKLKVIVRAFREVFLLYRQTDLGNPLYRDLFKFGATGLASTVVDFGILNVAVQLFHINLLVATFLGFLGGSTNGYLMNNAWTYKRLGKQAKTKGLVQYSLVGLVGLLLTEWIVSLLSVHGSLNYNISKLIAVAIVFFWNFFGNRFWTFRDKS